MKRLRLLLAGFVFIGALGAIGSSASAFDLLSDACSKNPEATACKDNDTSQTTTDNSIYGPNGAIGKVVRIMSIIIGVAAVIVIIIAGIQYMTSTGDATNVNNAKNAIIYALIGLLVAVIAQVLVLFVIGRLFG